MLIVIHQTAQEPPAGLWKHACLEDAVAFVRKAVAQGQFQPDALVPIQIEPCKAAFERVRARWEGMS